MFKIPLFRLIIALSTLSASTILSGADPELPPPDPSAVWNYIQGDDPAQPRYSSWEAFPGMQRNPMQATEEPHGAWVGVYLNGPAFNAIIKSRVPPMPYGSIIVKENYRNSGGRPTLKDLSSYTVMYKVKGYHSIEGEEEWYWVMYGPKGQVQTVDKQPWEPKFHSFKGEVLSGKPWFCLKCHTSAKEPNREGTSLGDYIFNVTLFAGRKP